MQEKVKLFMKKYKMDAGIYARFLDLVSEVGEFGKEINKSTKYGLQEYKSTSEIEDELGDCLFSLIALCVSLNMDTDQLLGRAIEKYEARFAEKGHIGSEQNH